MIRLASFALVLGLLVAGCGGSSSSAPPIADAKPFADSFVHGLVETGTSDAVEADVSSELMPQLRSFQAHLEQDGIKRVNKAGVLSNECPQASAVSAGKDCFVYVLSGSHVPIGESRKVEARLRVWPAYEDGRWEVVNYDYTVLPAPDED